MTQTITRLYDSYDTALRAALGLKEAGFTDREISLVGNRSRPYADDEPSAAAEDAGTGATIGGLVGAAAGLMAGLGVMAIPGIGPVVAAGWLASTLAVSAAGAVAGGATGGIVGALTGNGTTEEEANVYAESVRRGDSLVTVQVPDERVTQATEILSRYPAVSAQARLAEYRQTGWQRFDEAAAVRAAEDESVLPAGLPRTPPPP
jgi:hypothetical protein